VAGLLLDHNLSPRLAVLLRRAGHVAQTVRDLQLDAATDAEILRIAGRAGLIVLTADDDFIDLHRVTSTEHAGILRIPQPRRAEAATVVEALVSLLDAGFPLAGGLFAWTPEAGWQRWHDDAHQWQPLQ
jgi:predicted nuclease of predicted toxin-antitoxin system